MEFGGDVVAVVAGPVDLVDVVAVRREADVVVVTRVVLVVVTTVVEVVATAPRWVVDVAAISSPLRHPPANSPTRAITAVNFLTSCFIPASTCGEPEPFPDSRRKLGASPRR